MPAAAEEVLGPVAALIRAHDADEAVRAANQLPWVGSERVDERHRRGQRPGP
jgi:acyl-CoA reductase-like NAD-dependent aldehyde dehydrogenase